MLHHWPVLAKVSSVNLLLLLFCSTFLLRSLILEVQGQCRSLRFTIAPIHGCRLKNHLVQTIEITNEDICQLKCYLEPNCVSYNFNKKESADGKHKCDLNNATFELDSDLTKNGNYVYRGAENACAKKPCQNDATCQAGFTDRDYQCLCVPGFTGHDCEHEKPQFLVVCEGKSGIIACQEGKKISILDANYGRLDRDTCLHRAMSNINCRASSSLQIVQGKCNGKTECHLQPSNSVFGGDPCGGTFKYLQVKYRCQQEL